MISIENEKLTASINFKGAELISLKKKSTGTEYIWQADPAFWGRHAPILFPIVGRLKNDEYLINDKRYSLTQHGFARDMEFELTEKSDSVAGLLLKSTMDTRMAYPYKFHLKVQYSLKGSSLEISYEVINKSVEMMYFSIGGHPAFNCPVFPGDKKTDYTILFEKPENAFTQRLSNGLRNGKIIPVLENTNNLPITDDLFKDDALIFSDLNSEYVSLSKKSEKLLTLHFKNFPYLGIWSKSADAPFVCFEPWFGLADREDHDYNFDNKEGILHLDPNSSFLCIYTIEIH